MGFYLINMPDIGEGIAESEIADWTVAVGDTVKEDDIIAEVMTDKATVEIPSPVNGDILWTAGAAGDVLAVGSPFLVLEVAGDGNIDAETFDQIKAGTMAAPQGPSGESNAAETTPPAASAPAPVPAPVPAPIPAPEPTSAGQTAADSSKGGSQSTALPASQRVVPAQAKRRDGQPVASPAVRRRARDAGVKLQYVSGTGPEGRITHGDLDAAIEANRTVRMQTGSGVDWDTNTKAIKMAGMRRKIAEQMVVSKTRIPHYSYIEEVQLDALEALRAKLNQRQAEKGIKLTMLPFIMRAMVRAIQDFPQVNSIYDEPAGMIHQSGPIHIGVAAQTPSGLMVPVVKHVESLSIWDCAREVKRVSDAAKSGKIERSDLSGSTITITSLGAIGGIATTPVINHPEVAIVGINKMRIAPIWNGNTFVPTKVMNLSSSFDHRVIDGWDGAMFVQALRDSLENPALIFMEDQ